MNTSQAARMARRDAIKLIAAAAAAPAFLGACTTAGISPRPSGPAGTLTDPDLIHPVVPWPLTLSERERASLRVLCDTIIPADERSPAASAIGAADFIDEWVSAPYEAMSMDKALVREGLAWLDDEAQTRFGKRFETLDANQRTAICDDICHPAEAAGEFRQPAHFFDKVRILTAMAFYTTRIGMDDLGYVGNTPLDEWLPPPREVRIKAGLDS